MNKKINNTLQLLKAVGLLTALLILTNSSYAQKQFIVKGKLAKEKSGLIRLTYYSMGKTVVDSMQFKDGMFEFIGTIESPTDATLEINPIYGRPSYEERTRQDMRDFYLEEKETLIKSDSGLKAAIVTGGKQQKYFEEAEADELSVTKQMWALNDLGQKFREENNQAGIDSLRKKSVEINKSKDDLDSAFMVRYPDSYVAFQKLKLAELLSKYDDFTINTLFNHFNPEIRNSYHGKIFAEKIRIAKTLKKGMPAPEINLPDATGKLVSLSSLKGKYVLLYFSGSPDSRNVSNLFNRMAGKNFTIYMVTFTNNMDSSNIMQAAEAKEWTSVVDFNKIARPSGTLISPTAKAYNFTFAFNNCFLLDPAGNILLERMGFDPALPLKIENALK